MQRATPSLLAAAARHLHSAAAAPAPLFAVALLERLPVVAPDPPAWAATAAATAADRAAASRRQLPDLAPAADDGRAAAAGGGWVPAPRTTAADAAGDRTSLNRALDRRLFMIVRGAGDDSITTLFPSTRADDDEPMRAAAERALASAVTGCDAYFVGNAPAGHAAGAGPGGGSLFFHRAQLVGAGAPAAADPTAKLEWVTLDELVAAVGGEEGEGSVGRLLRRML